MDSQASGITEQEKMEENKEMDVFTTTLSNVAREIKDIQEALVTRDGQGKPVSPQDRIVEAVYNLGNLYSELLTIIYTHY